MAAWKAVPRAARSVERLVGWDGWMAVQWVLKADGWVVLWVDVMDVLLAGD